MIAGAVIADLRGHGVEEIENEKGDKEEPPATESRRLREAPFGAGGGDRNEAQDEEGSRINNAQSGSCENQRTQDSSAGNEADGGVGAGISEQDSAETERSS